MKLRKKPCGVIFCVVFPVVSVSECIVVVGVVWWCQVCRPHVGGSRQWRYGRLTHAPVTLTLWGFSWACRQYHTSLTTWEMLITLSQRHVESLTGTYSNGLIIWTLLNISASWQGPPKFWAVRKFCSSENCRLKMQILRLTTPILGKYRGKIEILSTHNVLCQKFAAVCRKIATSSCDSFFNPRCGCWEYFRCSRGVSLWVIPDWLRCFCYQVST